MGQRMGGREAGGTRTRNRKAAVRAIEGDGGGLEMSGLCYERTCEMCSLSASSGGGTNGVHLLGSTFRPQKAIVRGGVGGGRCGCV